VAGFFLPTIALFLWLRSRKRWRQAQLDRYDQRSLQKEALQPMYPASSPNDGGPVEKDGAMAQSEMDGQPVEASRRFVGELEGSGGALGGEGVAR